VIDGADAHVDATVVSGTLPRTSGLFGSGLIVRRGATIDVTDSLVDQNHQDGISVIGATATLDGVLVRETQPNGDGKFGEGIGVQYDTTHDLPSTLTLRGSVLDANHLSGLVVIAADATVETSLVRGTQLAQDLGRGINVQIDPETGRRATAVVRASLVEDTQETNVCVLDADLTLESSVIRGASPAPDGRFGDGLAVIAQASTASAIVQNTRIQNNARAGLLNVASAVGVGTNLFGCNAFDLEGEALGGNAYSFERLDANDCGCDEKTAECQVLTSGLEPPPALSP
jgi:hypothetical protein